MSPVVGAGTVEYEWMTWPEIAAAAAADAPVVIAVGSTEQHGPHLPVSADWVVPQALLRLAAARRPFIVGPPFGSAIGRGRPAAAVSSSPERCRCAQRRSSQCSKTCSRN